MKINCAELPQEYKNYKEIKQTNFQTNALEMKLIFKSLKRMLHYLNPKNNLIVETVEIDKKINKPFQ